MTYNAFLFPEAILDTPRLFTAIAEWLAIFVYFNICRRRVEKKSVWSLLCAFCRDSDFISVYCRTASYCLLGSNDDWGSRIDVLISLFGTGSDADGLWGCYSARICSC